MPDWDTVRLVLSVHRAGGLTGAARELGVSLPTVSRRLARAESDLRCVLFDRRQGRLTATEAGHLVIAEGARMERQMQRMQDGLRTLDSSMAGPIRISVPRGLLPYCLADEIRDFQRAHPDVEVRLLTSDALADFDAGAVDIVFRVEDNPRPSLWGERVAQLRFGFFAHRDLVTRLCRTEDNEGAPVIVHEGATGSSENLVREAFPDGRIVARCNSLEAMHALVATGMGIGRLPCLMGRSDQDLQEIPISVAMPTRSLWALTHKDLRSVRRVSAFIGFVADRLRNKPELFDPAETGQASGIQPFKAGD